MKIKGAYAVVQFNDDTPNYIEIMSMPQIKRSWAKTRTSGSVQKEFPEEMVKRTVINRACKLVINTSDDAGLFGDETEKLQNKETIMIENEIAEKANKGEEIGFEEKVVIDEPEPKEEEQKTVVEKEYQDKQTEEQLDGQLRFEAEF